MLCAPQEHGRDDDRAAMSRVNSQVDVAAKSIEEIPQTAPGQHGHVTRGSRFMDQDSTIPLPRSGGLLRHVLYALRRASQRTDYA